MADLAETAIVHCTMSTQSLSQTPCRTEIMSKSSNVVLIALLTALTAVPPLSTQMYLPSLPAMAGDLGTTAAMVQLTISTFFFAFALSQLVYGPFSDRFGRRPVLYASLGLYVAGSLACALAPTVEALIAARLLQAVGACGAPVIARAIVADVYGRAGAGRVLAYMGSIMGIAPGLGPILGGYLDVAFGWRSIFWLMVGLSALLFAGAAFMVRETNTHKNAYAIRPLHLLQVYGLLLGSRVFVGYSLTLACAIAGMFTYISSAPHLFVNMLRFTPDTFGFLFMITAAGWMISSAVTARIADKVGHERLLAIGVLLIAAAGSVFGGLIWSGIFGPVTLLLPVFVYAYGMGIAIHMCTAGAVTLFPRRTGSASAMLGFIQFTGSAFGALFAASLFDGTALPTGAGVALFSAAAAVVYFAVVRPSPTLLVRTGRQGAAIR